MRAAISLGARASRPPSPAARDLRARRPRSQVRPSPKCARVHPGCNGVTGWRARAHSQRSIAARAAHTCALTAQHCCAGGAHVRTHSAALLRGRRARAHSQRSIVARAAHTCALTAQHCCAGGAHVRTHSAALLRGRATRAHTCGLGWTALLDPKSVRNLDTSPSIASTDSPSTDSCLDIAISLL